MTSALSTFAKLTVIAMLFSACEEPAEYQYLNDDIAWKLLAFGEQGSARDSVQWMRLDAVVFNPISGDTSAVFYDVPFPEADDVLWKFLATRAINDSFLVCLGSPTFLTSSQPDFDTLHASISVKTLRTAAQLRDAKLTEFSMLDALMRNDSIAAVYNEYKGLWVRELSVGTDTFKVRQGKEVVIEYQGRHLDGRIFDDSRLMSGPFRFVYGNEGQVIKGLEIALERMHTGESVEVILPSWLAYGSKGSADGRVPPYTPVLYRVEVLEVARD